MDYSETFILAGNQSLALESLSCAVRSHFPDSRVVIAGSLKSVTTHVRACPDTTLVMLNLPSEDDLGLASIVALRHAHPAIPVLVISSLHTADIVARAIALGANGFVAKAGPAANLEEAVRAVCSGKQWTPRGVASLEQAIPAETRRRIRSVRELTSQQVRVLLMLAQGLLNKQIAHELGVTESTIKSHVSAILRKLGVNNRTQAVLALRTLGLDNMQDLTDSPAEK